GSVVVQDRAEAAVLGEQRIAAQVEQVQIERLVGLTLVVALVNPSRRQTRKARLPELLPANAEDEGCLAKEQDGTEKVFELAADIMDEVFECFADQTEGRADRLDDLFHSVAGAVENSDDNVCGQPQDVFQCRGHLVGAESDCLQGPGDGVSGQTQPGAQRTGDFFDVEPGRHQCPDDGDDGGAERAAEDNGDGDG